MAINKFGLSRDIPEPVKRAVRQRDGFGCVKCGMAIIEYEHIEPPFAEAKEHSAEGIVLLCASCHSLKTRKRLSIETLKECRKSPKAKSIGYSFGPFDVGTNPLIIHMGNLIFTNPKSTINVLGDDILSVSPPKNAGEPFLIDAHIFDSRNKTILKIVENEWQTPHSNWDIRVEGDKIVIYSGIRSIELVIRTKPPNILYFEKLELLHRGFSISAASGRDTFIITPSGDRLVTSGMSLVDCRIGLEVKADSFAIGVDCKSMSVDRMTINPTDFRQSIKKTADILPFKPKKI